MNPVGFRLELCTACNEVFLAAIVAYATCIIREPDIAGYIAVAPKIRVSTQPVAHDCAGRAAA